MHPLSVPAATLILAGGMTTILCFGLLPRLTPIPAAAAPAGPAVGPLMRLEGHTDHVYALVPSPDGKWFASVSEDASIRVWELPEGKLRHRLTGEHAFYDAVLVPSGQRLIASDGGGKIHCWDIKTGQSLWIRQTHRDAIYCVALHPKGHLLAVGGGENEPCCRLVSLQDGKTIRQLEGHENAIYGADFSHDGQWLATASADKTVRLWDPQTGKLRSVLKHPNYVYRCRFLPGKLLLATACHDRRVRMWDVSEGECVASWEESRGPVFCVAISSNGRYLFAGSEDRKLRVYDLTNGRYLGVIVEHRDAVYAVAVVADGRILSGGADSLIQVVPRQTLEPIRQR